MKVVIRLFVASLLIFVGFKLLLPYKEYPIEHFEFLILKIIPIGWKVVAIVSRVIIGFVFVSAFLFLFYWKKIKLVKYASILMMSIPFIINPVFPKDLKDNNKISSELPYYISNTTDKDKIQIYASSNCLHCKEAIKKLKVAQSLSTNFPEVIIVSYNKEINQFLEENEIIFPLDSIGAKEFVEITKGIFPKFQFIQNNKLNKTWTNKEFNYAVLDNLSE